MKLQDVLLSFVIGLMFWVGILFIVTGWKVTELLAPHQLTATIATHPLASIVLLFFVFATGVGLNAWFRKK